MDYKKHQWTLYKAKKQQQEVEKAIIGFGQYNLRSQYYFLSGIECHKNNIRNFNTSVHQTASSDKFHLATAVSEPPGTSSSSVNFDQ